MVSDPAIIEEPMGELPQNPAFGTALSIDASSAASMMTGVCASTVGVTGACASTVGVTNVRASTVKEISASLVSRSSADAASDPPQPASDVAESATLAAASR